MKKLARALSRDDVSEVLQAARFSAAVFCRSELRAPWGFSVISRDFASFHIVTRGKCCVDVEGIGERMWLEEGDLVVLPSGHAHAVRDAPGSPVTRLEKLISTSRTDVRGILRAGGSGAMTGLLCGGFRFEDRTANPLLAALPPVIHLSGRTSAAQTWLKFILGYLSEEARDGRPGAETAITRLADLLFVEVLRTYFSTRGALKSGLSVALRDPRIAAAMLAMHRQPEVRWNVDGLASNAAMSRSAFSTRFKRLLGESPIAYLTRCRMTHAVAELRSSTATIANIAGRSGYGAEASFSRAFKRWVGTSPAAFRDTSARRVTGRGLRRSRPRAKG